MWDLDMLCNYVSNICPSSDETHIHIYKLHCEFQLVNRNFAKKIMGGGGSPRILNSATLSAWMTHRAIVHRILHLYHTHIVPSHIQGVTNCRSKYIIRSTVWEIFRCANFDVQGHVEMMRVNIQAGRSQQQRKCERWVMTVESHLRFTQQGTSLLLWGFSLGPSHWELDYVCVCVCVCLSSLRR